MALTVGFEATYSAPQLRCWFVKTLPPKARFIAGNPDSGCRCVCGVAPCSL